MDLRGSCPRCGANLRVERRGELHDKFLTCGHCGFERDVPDEVTISTEEDGRRVRIHRRDVPAGDGTAPPLDPATLAFFEEFQKEGAAGRGGAEPPRHLGGKRVTTTTTEQQVWTGDAATQKLAEMGVDLDDLMAEAGATPPGADGTSTTTTVERQTFTGDAAAEKLAEMGIDPDALPATPAAPRPEGGAAAPPAPAPRRAIWPWLLLAVAMAVGLAGVVIILALVVYLQG